ncbi:flagellar assembly protein FliH [Nitratidesulfovibrio sp. HK-II]|uniref:FliH/SctL family protein n=1 Tax=Nitratidesulfovibrio sp. HK-II TaxID=2009266 RepID=UPI000E2F5346|nr:FliH/SctL family protein [Nitratidesulfovibrio sp. HK-II]GBO97182.1 flagellar assembly protein FliH [Nitratidesulfovibrio sp. HK-II]
MSSSDAEKPDRWGTIFMGPGPLGETTLTGMEGASARPLWDEHTEEEYMERVRAKAEAKAREMLTQARMEAEVMRAAAHDEGYNAGMAQAHRELEEFRAAMGESVSAVLSAIQGQCSSIFAGWRADLVGLLRAAVERGVGLVVDAERAAVLETLFVKSVQALEQRRTLTVRVNPEDEPAVADIIAATKERFPGLEAWTVRGDAAIGPGGMVVESRDGMVDNTIETRRRIVEEVLAGLTLPEDRP